MKIITQLKIIFLLILLSAPTISEAYLIHFNFYNELDRNVEVQGHAGKHDCMNHFDTIFDKANENGIVVLPPPSEKLPPDNDPVATNATTRNASNFHYTCHLYQKSFDFTITDSATRTAIHYHFRQQRRMSKSLGLHWYVMLSDGSYSQSGIDMYTTIDCNGDDCFNHWHQAEHPTINIHIREHTKLIHITFQKTHQPIDNFRQLSQSLYDMLTSKRHYNELLRNPIYYDKTSFPFTQNHPNSNAITYNLRVSIPPPSTS